MGLPVELSPVDLSSKVTLSEVSAVRLSICRHFVRASSEVSDVPSVDALCFFLTVCSSCPPDWLVPASRSFTCSSRCRCARCPRSTPCPGRHRRRGGAWGTCAGAGTGTASLCWPRRRKAGSGFSGHWTAGTDMETSFCLWLRSQRPLCVCKEILAIPVNRAVYKKK
jgi:hypothetical protein